MFNHFNEANITLTYKPHKDNTKKRKKENYRPVLLTTIYKYKK